MSKHLDKLHAMLNELKDELQSVDTLDDPTRRSLEDMMDEINSALHKSDHARLQHHTLLEQLNEAGQHFERSHPTLARIVGNIIDALGQIGI